MLITFRLNFLFGNYDYQIEISSNLKSSRVERGFLKSRVEI